MDFNIAPQAALLIGILFQSATHIRNGTGIVIMLFSVCFACISLYTKTVDGKHMLEITPDKIIPFGLLYIFFFSFMSREEMLKKITESQILAVSVFFALGTFTLLADASPLSAIIKIFAVISLVLFYFLSVTKFRLPRFLKLACYLVFLVMNIVLMVMLLSIHNIYQLFNFENHQVFSIFLNGAILFSLGAQIVNLFLIFPLPTKIGRMEESWKLAAEHRNLLISKIHDERDVHNPIKLISLIIACMVTFVVLSNYLQPILILQILLIGSSYFFSYKNKGIISK